MLLGGFKCREFHYDWHIARLGVPATTAAMRFLNSVYPYAFAYVTLNSNLVLFGTWRSEFLAVVHSL